MIKPLFSLAAASVMLSACATGYQAWSNMGGGYTNSAGPGQLERVGFSGNGYTSAATAEIYTLYRCAELASARQKSYFILYDSLSDATRNVPVSAPRVTMLTQYPSASVYMLALDAPTAGALNTQEVLDSMRNLIDIGTKKKD